MPERKLQKPSRRLKKQENKGLQKSKGLIKELERKVDLLTHRLQNQNFDTVSLFIPSFPFPYPFPNCTFMMPMDQKGIC